MEILRTTLFYQLTLAIFLPLALLCSLFFFVSRRRSTGDEQKRDAAGG